MTWLNSSEATRAVLDQSLAINKVTLQLHSALCTDKMSALGFKIDSTQTLSMCPPNSPPSHHGQYSFKDRQQWIHKGKTHIEERISQKYQHDHNLRHGFPDASVPIIFCVNCGRGFKSQIGLFSNQRAEHVTDETLH